MQLAIVILKVGDIIWIEVDKQKRRQINLPEEIK